MSVGTPTMRQRHSQGYSSSGDDMDLEDDACSRPCYASTSTPKTRKFEVIESLLWIASVIFIIYYGDRRSNFIYLLWQDNRIKRIPLYVGMAGVCLNVLFFVYTSILAWGLRNTGEKWEVSSASVLPFVTLLGLLSFCSFSFALWPIWSFLTLPLLFTLFMACMVLLPYFVLGMIKRQSDSVRRD